MCELISTVTVLCTVFLLITFITFAYYIYENIRNAQPVCQRKSDSWNFLDLLRSFSSTWKKKTDTNLNVILPKQTTKDYLCNHRRSGYFQSLIKLKCPTSNVYYKKNISLHPILGIFNNVTNKNYKQLQLQIFTNSQWGSGKHCFAQNGKKGCDGGTQCWVRVVDNLACSCIGKFQIFLTFDAKFNMLRIVKLKVKVSSVTHPYWNWQLVFNFGWRQPKNFLIDITTQLLL